MKRRNFFAACAAGVAAVFGVWKQAKPEITLFGQPIVYDETMGGSEDDYCGVPGTYELDANGSRWGGIQTYRKEEAGTPNRTP